MVTLVEAETRAQPPDAGTVLVIEYVPGVLAARSICPVAVFTNTNPGVEENVPAVDPAFNTGKGLAAVLQKGVPA